ncbi:hypothetical protein DVK07_15870 [Halorubrum sp. Atlit-26R]|nr:hypothetical protein DVK07_15870 [Halorubrum sp. Atlit-26R]
MVEELIYQNDAVAYDGNDFDAVAGGVNFSVTNRVGEDVTITDVRVTPRNSAISDLSDDGLPNGEPVTSEVYVAADLADAYVDYDDGTALPKTVDLDTDGFTNNGNAQLSDGATATFYLYEFTNGFSSVDMSGEDVEITITYQPASGGTETKTFTITPNSGDAGSGGNQAPTIDTFQTTDTSKTGGNPKYAQFDVDWTVSDDSQVQSLELTMARVGSGNEVDSATPSVSGASASGVTSLRGPDQSPNPGGQQYDITITVTDDDGETSSQTQQVTVS